MFETALAQNFGADRLHVAAPGLHGRVNAGDFGVPATQDSLVAPFLALDYVAHESWAWNNYKCTIKALAAQCAARNAGRAVRVLEITSRLPQGAEGGIVRTQLAGAGTSVCCAAP